MADGGSPLDRESVQRVLRSVLYEGYALYPYRADSLKNQRRWMFGTLHPPHAAPEPELAQTECLVLGDAPTRVEARVVFLQPVERLDDDGTWEEAVEREIVLPDRTLASLVVTPEATTLEFAGEEHTDGRVVRRRPCVRVALERHAVAVGDGAFRLTVVVRNVTAAAVRARPEDARLAVLASTHTLLGVRGGRFVSLLDPPPALREAAAACRSLGTWPVLVGEPGADDALLSSPIILSDHPRVAAESPGDLFDLTEIDEILTLRIRTLTDAERDAGRRLDPRVRGLLDRAATLDPRGLERLHGAVRERTAADAARGLRAGARVRLRPRARADVLDLALAGKTATIATIEQDVEGRVFVVVTVDDDPGRDLGARGEVGHRFFFGPEEVELLP